MKKKIKIRAAMGVGFISTATVLPIAIQATTNKAETSHIKLFNRNFGSREDLIQYALSTSRSLVAKDGNTYFSINDSGEKIFENDYDLRKYISDNIERIVVKASSDIGQKYLYSDNSIADSKVSQILASNNSDTLRYYRGIHDTVFQNRLNAIKSYFQYHKVFYYDGITFRNKQELKSYLYKNYFNLKVFNLGNKKNIESPSGLVSPFFDFNSKIDRTMGREFIYNTANSLVGIKNSNGNYNFINASDISADNINNNFWQNLPLNQINAVHITPNNGKALWITDSKRTDTANFYGKYFTRSKSNEISFMNNSNKWTGPVGKVHLDNIKKAKNADKIGKFFAALNKLSAYQGLDLRKSNDSELAKVKEVEHILDVPKYKKQLAQHSSLKEVVEKLKETSDALSQGRRYNPLYELPILYTQTLSNIQKWNLKNKDLNYLRAFFQNVADDYQKTLEALFPREALVDRDGNPFTIADLFKINDSSFDLNSDPEIQMYKLAESPKFVKAINVYSEAITNKISNGGSLSFFMSKFSKDNDFNDYYLRLWTTLSGRADEIKINGDTKEEYVSKALGRKVSHEQAVYIENLLKVNDKMEDSNNQLLQTVNEKDAEKIIATFSKNNVINWNQIDVASGDNSEYVNIAEKAKKMKATLLAKNESINKIGKAAYFKNAVKKITTKDVFSSNFKTKVFNSNKIKSLSARSSRALKQAVHDTFSSSKTSFEKRIKVAKKINNAVNRLEGVRDTVIGVANLAQSIQVGDTYSALKSVSSLLGTFSSVTAQIPLLGASAQVLSFIFDFAAEAKGKKIQDIYRFKTTEDDATPFYWDGGVTTVRFWGLSKTEEIGKSSMKIMEPQKITNGSVSDYWLYNGQKFKDEDTLKKQAFIDFAKGDNDAVMLGNKNNFLKRSFTYQKIVANKQISRGTLITDTKRELAETIIPLDLTSSVLKEYLNSTQFELIGGKVTQTQSGSITSAIKKANINGLLSKIKPTIVTQLPKTINDVPIDQFSLSELPNKGSMKEIYELPGEKYYSNGVVHTRNQHNTNHYLQINMNQTKPKSSKNAPTIFEYPSLVSAQKTLEDNFIKNIKVKNILSMQSQFMNVNKFSQLTDTKEIKLFKARGIGGEIKYFKTFLDSYNWLISKPEFDLKKIIQQSDNTKMTFNGIIFENTRELISYLDQLLEKAGK